MVIGGFWFIVKELRIEVTVLVLLLRVLLVKIFIAV